MYAVIETGGKQYRVTPGQTLEVDLLPALPGDEVTLERVLLVSDDTQTLVGAPVVPGGRVVGTVVREGRGKKIIVFRYKSKARYRRTTGHRQDYLYLTITDIQANGASLLSDEERHRLRHGAQRAARRFETRQMARAGLFEELADEGRDQAPSAPATAAEPAPTPAAELPTGTAATPSMPPSAPVTPAAEAPAGHAADAERAEPDGEE